MIQQSQARRPRIAYLINQYPKISHTFIRNEIRALEAKGYDVLRIAIRGWDAELIDPVDIAEQNLTHYILREGVRKSAAAFLRSFLKRPIVTLIAFWHAIRLGVGGDRPIPYHLMYLAEACLVQELAFWHEIDHIHAHFGSNATEVAMLSHILGGPKFSFTVHGPEEFDKPNELKIRQKISAADFTVGVSSFGRSQLYRYASPRDWHNIHVVHCGLGRDYLDAYRQPLDEDNHLVCVGRLCEQKGQIVLIRACKILVDRDIDFHITLVGDGEMRRDIEQEIDTTGLGDYITITGWLGSDDIRRLLTSSKGLVLPSFAEGLPVVIMEAMALGRPVISTYVAGIPELIRDRIDGFLVPAGDAIRLADMIETLLKLDPKDAQDMGDNAHGRVVERHSSILEAEKLEKLFNKYR